MGDSAKKSDNMMASPDNSALIYDDHDDDAGLLPLQSEFSSGDYSRDRAYSWDVSLDNGVFSHQDVFNVFSAQHEAGYYQGFPGDSSRSRASSIISETAMLLNTDFTKPQGTMKTMTKKEPESSSSSSSSSSKSRSRSKAKEQDKNKDSGEANVCEKNKDDEKEKEKTKVNPKSNSKAKEKDKDKDQENGKAEEKEKLQDRDQDSENGKEMETSRRTEKQKDAENEKQKDTEKDEQKSKDAENAKDPEKGAMEEKGGEKPKPKRSRTRPKPKPKPPVEDTNKAVESAEEIQQKTTTSSASSGSSGKGANGSSRSKSGSSGSIATDKKSSSPSTADASKSSLKSTSTSGKLSTPAESAKQTPSSSSASTSIAVASSSATAAHSVPSTNAPNLPHAASNPNFQQYHQPHYQNDLSHSHLIGNSTSRSFTDMSSLSGGPGVGMGPVLPHGFYMSGSSGGGGGSGSGSGVDPGGMGGLNMGGNMPMASNPGGLDMRFMESMMTVPPAGSEEQQLSSNGSGINSGMGGMGALSQFLGASVLGSQSGIPMLQFNPDLSYNPYQSIMLSAGRGQFLDPSQMHLPMGQTNNFMGASGSMLGAAGTSNSGAQSSSGVGPISGSNLSMYGQRLGVVGSTAGDASGPTAPGISSHLPINMGRLYENPVVSISGGLTTNQGGSGGGGGGLNEYRIGAYTREERRQKIEAFRMKKRQRIWQKQIKYDCRKRLADTRPRIKGRFVRNWNGSGDGDDDNESSADGNTAHTSLAPTPSKPSGAKAARVNPSNGSKGAGSGSSNRGSNTPRNRGNSGQNNIAASCSGMDGAIKGSGVLPSSMMSSQTMSSGGQTGSLLTTGGMYAPGLLSGPPITAEGLSYLDGVEGMHGGSGGVNCGADSNVSSGSVVPMPLPLSALYATSLVAAAAAGNANGLYNSSTTAAAAAGSTMSSSGAGSSASDRATPTSPMNDAANPASSGLSGMSTHTGGNLLGCGPLSPAATTFDAYSAANSFPPSPAAPEPQFAPTASAALLASVKQELPLQLSLPSQSPSPIPSIAGQKRSISGTPVSASPACRSAMPMSPYLATGSLIVQGATAAATANPFSLPPSLAASMTSTVAAGLAPVDKTKLELRGAGEEAKSTAAADAASTLEPMQIEKPLQEEPFIDFAKYKGENSSVPGD